MLKRMQNILPKLDISKFPDLAQMTSEEKTMIEKVLKAEVVWQDLKVISMDDQGLQLAGDFSVKSYYLREVFHDALRVTVACVTLGQGIIDFIQEKMAEKEYYMAALADSYASQYVELLANHWMSLRQQEYKSKGLYPSLRFSPGYGDFSLSYQPQIIELLEMGDRVQVSSSFILQPEKTTTFLLAWCPLPQKQEYPDIYGNSCPGGGNCSLCRTKACLKMNF